MVADKSLEKVRSRSNSQKVDKTLTNILKIKEQREKRRIQQQNHIDYRKKMIDEFEQKGVRSEHEFEQILRKRRSKFSKTFIKHTKASDHKLCVCVRKRPLFQKEKAIGMIDVVTSANPKLFVHCPKYKVDGITKYLDDHSFLFDNTFDEKESTSYVYEYSIKSLIKDMHNKGKVTVFAYGQTGSGKTYTMVL